MPWRTTPRDPYRVLVSEVMLQRTQATRVAARLESFLARFPSVQALANAPRQEVLAAWSGLGYYRRAIHLHAAARMIVRQHGGQVPADEQALRRLPGIGPYTAGAIAAIAFGRPVPGVDSNVARVMTRLTGRDPASDPQTRSARLRESVGHMMAAGQQAGISPGLVLEALIELGAVVCTPRRPACPACPLRQACVAYASGAPTRLPRPTPAPPRTVLFCATVVVCDNRGRVLMERRSTTRAPAHHSRPGTCPSGLWAGLWQCPTRERADRAWTAGDVRRWTGLPRLRPIASFSHNTTRRRVHFQVWHAGIVSTRWGTRIRQRTGGRWFGQARLPALPLSSPQRRILKLADLGQRPLARAVHGTGAEGSVSALSGSGAKPHCGASWL